MKPTLALEEGKRVWRFDYPYIWYLFDNQAQSFLAFKNNPEYHDAVTGAEIKIIQDNRNKVLSLLSASAYNIVDLGSGDGETALALIEILGKQIKTRYFPVDTSAFMVRQALNHARTVGVEIIETDRPVSFSDTSRIREILDDRGHAHTLFCFFGSNFINLTNPTEILEKFKTLMKTGDILMAGNTLTDYGTFEVRPAEEAKEEDAFFSNSLQTEWGLPRSHLQFYERKKNGGVETCYKVLQDTAIHAEGGQIELKRGDIVVVYFSAFHTREQLIDKLEEIFPTSTFLTNQTETVCISLSTA